MNRKDLLKRLQNFPTEKYIEKLFIFIAVFVFLINAYFHFNTDILKIDNITAPSDPKLRISFSNPVSRMIVSVHSHPKSEFSINWDRATFRNSLYKEMIIESNKSLLPGQEYIINVKGLRTVDRTRKIPLLFVAKVLYPDKSKFVEYYNKIEENDETYISSKEFPDMVELYSR
jgi:hypothetical protein